MPLTFVLEDTKWNPRIMPLTRCYRELQSRPRARA